MEKPKFSIVVPAYNEADDIVGTIESLISLDGPSKEIVIVDDASIDATADIVRQYENRGVRLLRQPQNKGRCAARNRGIRESAGEVVVILNADVQLPKDFLTRLEPHYANGFDYVCVEAEISNMEKVFPRFLEAQHRFLYRQASWIEWTEGFSCRREAAIAVGLFPTDFPIPLTSGEDGFFGNALRKAGYKKLIDRSIVVKHIAPESLRSYWHQRFERGYAGPLVWHYLEKMSYRDVCFKLFKAIPGYLFAFITLIPVIREVMLVSRFADHGYREFGGFFIASYIERLARFVGGWVAAYKLGQSRRNPVGPMGAPKGPS